jgi:hypothetical protein
MLVVTCEREILEVRGRAVLSSLCWLQLSSGKSCQLESCTGEGNPESTLTEARITPSRVRKNPGKVK